MTANELLRAKSEIPNGVYVRMMKDHPIQKEFRRKGGRAYLKEQPRVIDDTWLPLQEDWQEIAEKHKIKQSKLINQLSNAEPEYDLNNPEFGYAQSWTILWCLFVSKEVYGLEWNWEESVWFAERCSTCCVWKYDESFKPLPDAEHQHTWEENVWRKT